MAIVPLGWVGFDGGAKRAISFAKRREPDDEDVAKHTPNRPNCVEDGTLLDLTLTGITVCGSGCAVTADGKRYNVTGDPNDLIGVWEDIPLNSLTTITTLEMQAYTDDCVTPDGDPVMVDIQVLITCSTGYYSVSVQFDTPTSPSVTAQVFFTSGSFMLDEAQANGQECTGSTTVNVPFTIDSAEVSLAVP